MHKARALALSIATAALVVSLPAAADPPTTFDPPPPPAPAAYAPPSGYPLPPALPPAIDRQSTTAMVGGAALTGLGGVLILASTIAFMVPTCSATRGEVCMASEATPVGLLVAGLVAAAAGIPLVVYGAKRVPVMGGATTGSVPPSALPAWVGAPRGNGWAWRF
jgi:hypothetical protein